MREFAFRVGGVLRKSDKKPVDCAVRFQQTHGKKDSQHVREKQRRNGRFLDVSVTQNQGTESRMKHRLVEACISPIIAKIHVYILKAVETESGLCTYSWLFDAAVVGLNFCGVFIVTTRRSHQILYFHTSVNPHVFHKLCTPHIMHGWVISPNSQLSLLSVDMSSLGGITVIIHLAYIVVDIARAAEYYRVPFMCTHLYNHIVCC